MEQIPRRTEADSDDLPEDPWQVITHWAY